MTFRMTADVPPNRQLVLTLPETCPLGRAEFVVSIDSSSVPAKRPRTSLADWADEHAEDWGDRLSSEDVESFTGRRF